MCDSSRRRLAGAVGQPMAGYAVVDQVIEGGAHPRIPPGHLPGLRRRPSRRVGVPHRPPPPPQRSRVHSGGVWRRYTRAKPGTDRHAESTPGLAQGGSSCENSLGCLKVDLTAGRARERGGLRKTTTSVHGDRNSGSTRPIHLRDHEWRPRAHAEKDTRSQRDRREQRRRRRRTARSATLRGDAAECKETNGHGHIEARTPNPPRAPTPPAPPETHAEGI